jgi:hypothetical protein
LRVGPAFDHGGAVSWVAPVELRDGSEAVLKISIPQDEARFEAQALRFLNDRGAVRRGLETQARNLSERASQETDLRLIIGHLDDFAATITDTLDHLDWEAQCGIIRTLVKPVEIEQGQVNVVFRIGPGPLMSGPDPTSLHY